MNLIWQAPLSYLSLGDEYAFFSWLNSVPNVLSVNGVGRELHITFKTEIISDETLRELIAIYSRYKGNMKELMKFSNSGNESWFKNDKAYWYSNVFE